MIEEACICESRITRTLGSRAIRAGGIEEARSHVGLVITELCIEEARGRGKVRECAVAEVCGRADPIEGTGRVGRGGRGSVVEVAGNTAGVSANAERENEHKGQCASRQGLSDSILHGDFPFRCLTILLVIVFVPVVRGLSVVVCVVVRVRLGYRSTMMVPLIGHSVFGKVAFSHNLDPPSLL